MSEIKATEWEFVVYDRDANFFWRTILSTIAPDCEISNMHVNEVTPYNGSKLIMPSHYHVLLKFDKPVTREEATNIADLVRGTDVKPVLDDAREENPKNPFLQNCPYQFDISRDSYNPFWKREPQNKPKNPPLFDETKVDWPSYKPKHAKDKCGYLNREKIVGDALDLEKLDGVSPWMAELNDVAITRIIRGIIEEMKNHSWPTKITYAEVLDELDNERWVDELHGDYWEKVYLYVCEHPDFCEALLQ